MYDKIYQSPNFGYPRGVSGRNGQDIIGICLHVTGANWTSNYHWMMNPAANASYNCVVREDGSTASLVPEQNAAYSHGRINKPTWPLLKSGVNPNLYTLSLARTGANQNTWTDEQLVSTLDVLRTWAHQYDIPLKRPYIFGHFEIDSVNRWYCPGRPFFDAVISEIEAEGGTMDRYLWHRVIAGSFQQADNAIFRQDALRRINISTFIAPYLDEENKTWYRVVAGSYMDQGYAKRFVNSLKYKGIDAFIVQHREAM